MEKDETAGGQVARREEHPLPPYAPPVIITYTAEQIMEEIGPAFACSPTPCPTTD
jgi:hypothetical protein